MATIKRDKKEAPSEYISLDLIPDPLVILRQDGTVHDINTSFSNLLGTKKGHLIGRNFKKLKLLDQLGDKITRTTTKNAEDFDRITFNNKHFEVFILPFRTKDNSSLIRIILKDISNFIRLEKELLKRNKELIITNTLSSVFISTENMDLVLEDLLEKVLLITDFHTGWILLKEDLKFRLKSSRGISHELQKNIQEGALESFCNDTLRLGEPLYVAEPSEISNTSVFHGDGIVFLVAIPLTCEKIPTGFLFLASRVTKDFDFDFAALLSLVGNHVSNIIDKIRLFLETKRFAITDSLTNLYNPRYFYECLDLEIARTNRYGKSFSLILFDIDNFKRINDTYGHLAGDEVLQGLANILKSISRETDIVVRYGGEEFIIILPNTYEEETILLAERIIDIVHKTTFMAYETTGVKVTLSGGIASYPQNASDARNLLSAADTALYSAKAAGKNQIFCFKGKIDEKNFQKTQES